MQLVSGSLFYHSHAIWGKLQNWHFYIAKLALLECKTHHFGMQNAPFWNAKRTILENSANGIVLEMCYSLIINCLC